VLNFQKRIFLHTISPIGALTSKPYVFGYRPWESRNYEVFDPKSEFYQPILITVVNNGIHRVLPINKNFERNGFQNNYQWIPNRLRFFFESMNLNSTWFHPTCENTSFRINVEKQVVFRRTLMPAHWMHILKSLSSQIQNFSNFYKFFLQFKNFNNFDLHSILELNNLCVEVPNLIKINTCLAGGSNSLINILNYRCCSLANFSFKNFSKVILISFNPYFVSPAFNYLLKTCSDLNSIRVYTMFFSYFSMNFQVENSIPNTSNVVKLFSGRHYWSKFMTNQDVAVIFDYNFLNSLPNHVLLLIFNFFFGSSTNKAQNLFITNKFTGGSYLENIFFTEASKFSNNYSNATSAVGVYYNNFYSTFRGYLNFNNSSTIEKNINISFSKSKTFSVLDSQEWSYLFKPIISLFSQFSIQNKRNDMYYFLPVSNFVELTAKYGVFEFPEAYSKNFSSVYRPSGRSTAQIFYFFRKYFEQSKNYSHGDVNNFIFFIFFIFVYPFCSHYSKIWEKTASLNNKFWYILFNFFFRYSSFIMYDLKKNNFYFKSSLRNLQYTHKPSSLFLDSFFKFMPANNNNRKSNIFFSKQISNFTNNYQNPSIDLTLDCQVEYSKTLTLNRQFFNLRFKNFS